MVNLLAHIEEIKVPHHISNNNNPATQVYN